MLQKLAPGNNFIWYLLNELKEEIKKKHKRLTLETTGLDGKESQNQDKGEEYQGKFASPESCRPQLSQRTTGLRAKMKTNGLYVLVAKRENMAYTNAESFS